MSNQVSESLMANIEEIKKNLPEELQAGLEAQLKAEAEQAHIPEADEAELIKAELKANPDVDDAAAIPEFEKNPTAHQITDKPSEAELKAEMEALLKERENEEPENREVG